MDVRVERNVDQVAARVAELRRDIEHHNYLYHVRNSPEISDEEYRRLKKIDAFER